MRGFSQKESQAQREGGAEPARFEKPAPKPGRDARPAPAADARQAAPRPPHARPDGAEDDAAAPRLTRPARDFSLVPARAQTTTRIQPKLDAYAPADAAEQEADRIAEQLTTMPEPAAPATSPAVPAPSSAAQRPPRAASRPLAPSAFAAGALRSAGRPLDATTRAFVESRSGWDFSQVRVHADGDAARSAAALGARAYTSGRDIVFGAGQYAPANGDGRRLLVHELAHVMQQSASAASAPVRFKKEKGPPKPFYQEALDTLEQVRKQDVIKLSTGGEIDMFRRLPVVRKFIELAEAIDAEDVKEIPTLLADFVKSDTSNLPLTFPSDALITTMITRLLVLGLGDAAMQLKAWFHAREREQGPHEKRNKRNFSYEKFLWENVLEELTGRIPEKGGDAALKILDALLLFFEKVRDERAGLDPEEIKKDQQRRREMYSALDSPWTLIFSEDVTISVYFAALSELLRKTFSAIQSAYQVVLDEAVADLGANRGDKFLKAAKDRLENRLRVLVEPEKGSPQAAPVNQLGGTSIEITRSEFRKGGGRHLDFFAKGKEARKRTADINFYDETALPELASEKEVSFAHIFLVRRRQIAVLENIYGYARDAQGKPTAETEENKKAVERLGKDGLRLESDDDWRRFLLEKFEAHKAKSNPTDALESVIRLLESFLLAFTTHTPYNIKDFGDNVLTKQFPRAMTGQLIQDCGVYALRIAYMLSLLREHKDLQLRFRFIALPVHVGLIITGKDLPLYIAHNDRISRYTAEETAGLRKEWNRLDEQGEERQPTGKDEEAQFVAELAANEFVSGVDLPYKLLDVPKPKGGPAAIKEQLWYFYTHDFNAVKLFSRETEDPKNPNYQFHLRYLKTLELIKQHHKNHLMPFWNGVAHPTWLRLGPGITKAHADMQSKKGDEAAKARLDYEAKVKEYVDIIEPALKAADDAYEPVRESQREIRDVLTKHPEVLNKGIGRTSSERLDAIVASPLWWTNISNHLFELKIGKLDTPPYAKPEDKLWPLD